MRFGLIFGIAALGLGIGFPVFASSQSGPLAVSVTTSPNPYAIEGTTSVPNSSGILAYATASKDVALQGYATQPGATGLEGFAQATSGAASNGVFGYSGNGTGVYGVSATDSAPGVFGSTTSSTGIGVYGRTPGTGVLGVTTSPSNAYAAAAGIEGLDEATGAIGQVGVYGSSTVGTGVLGNVSSPQDFAYTARGAVIGTDYSANTGYLGVFGASTAGIGVVGETTDGNAGIQAIAQNSGGVDGAGLQAESIDGIALQAFIDGAGDAFEAFEGDTFGAGYAEIARLDSEGNLVLNGSVTSTGNVITATPDRTGVERATYEQRATQSTVEDFGHGRLSAGRADVPLDPAFASILADPSDYYVFVTPRGPGELYVSAATASGFQVRALSGPAALAFDYRVVGRPRTVRAEPRLAAIDLKMRSKAPDPRAGYAARHPYATPILRGRSPSASFGADRAARVPGPPPMPFVPRTTTSLR